MKKAAFLLALLMISVLLCGCEALSLSENIQPYFAGPGFHESETYYKDYYYPSNDFEDAPSKIFKPTSYGGEFIDKNLIVAGTVESTERINGMKYYIVTTDNGTIYISNQLFTLDKIADGTAVEMYFVYTGYDKDLGFITGAYVQYLNR